MTAWSRYGRAKSGVTLVRHAAVGVQPLTDRRVRGRDEGVLGPKLAVAEQPRQPAAEQLILGVGSAAQEQSFERIIYGGPRPRFRLVGDGDHATPPFHLPKRMR